MEFFLVKDMENRLKMILAIVNNKDGVGKTTTVQNLAAGMLRKDKNLRILEIDLVLSVT